MAKESKTSSKSMGRYRDRLRERDGDLCFFCDEIIEHPDFSVEHLLARALGGKNDLDNLKLAHRDCNTHAGSLTIPSKMKLREIGTAWGRGCIELEAKILRRREIRETFTANEPVEKRRGFRRRSGYRAKSAYGPTPIYKRAEPWPGEPVVTKAEKRINERNRVKSQLVIGYPTVELNSSAPDARTYTGAGKAVRTPSETPTDASESNAKAPGNP